jgi:hypothetical protein
VKGILPPEGDESISRRRLYCYASAATTHQPCHCEGRSSQTILVVYVRVTRNNTITVPLPLRAEVQAEFSIKVPAAQIALSVGVVSHGDYGSVGLKPHSVSVPRGDLDYVRPGIDIALSIDIASHGDHCAIEF